MQNITFQLSEEDSSGIFYYTGIRKGQIIGLMTPHLITRYLGYRPFYGSSDVHPDYLIGKDGRKYWYVYSSKDTFDVAKSLQIGYGRNRDVIKPVAYDGLIVLRRHGKDKFLATVFDDISTINQNLSNGRINIKKLTSSQVSG